MGYLPQFLSICFWKNTPRKPWMSSFQRYQGCDDRRKIQYPDLSMSHVPYSTPPNFQFASGSIVRLAPSSWRSIPLSSTDFRKKSTSGHWEIRFLLVFCQLPPLYSTFLHQFSLDWLRFFFVVKLFITSLQSRHSGYWFIAGRLYIQVDLRKYTSFPLPLLKQRK